MTYAILRTRKHKTFASVARSARHTFREQLTPNADPEKLSCNRTVGANGAAHVLETLRGRLPAKRRSDAVLCIEYLFTASPEAFKRHGGYLNDLGGGYFGDALAWLKHRHGAGNVISSTVHLDESTPHMVAYVIPLTKDRRLSCRDFLGGPAKLREMQDSFHTTCGLKYGLERGLRGAKAKHEDVTAFYATLAKAGDAPQLRRKDYAAAALGIKTAIWKQAEDVTKANVLRVEHDLRIRKANQSRCKTLNKIALELEEKQQVYAHRNVMLGSKESDLDRRSRALSTREKHICEAQHKLLVLESERDALLRRLEILDARGSDSKKAPERGRVFDSECTLG